MGSEFSVLIVDDDEQFRLMVASAVRGFGENALEASTPEQAIEIFKSQRPEMVLLDVHMPEMSGIDLTKVLLTHNAHALIALVTGRSEEQLVIDALKVGATDFLKKPFRLAELRALLSRFSWILRRQREKTLSREHFESAHFEFVLESSKSSIAPTVHFVRELLKGFLSGPEIIRLDLAMQEVLTNAFEHGNLGIGYDEKLKLCGEGQLEEELEKRAVLARQQGKKIRLSADIHEGIFVCSISDEGEGFDWRKVPDLTSGSATLENLHGRGMMIVRRAFDEVVYNEKGNQVTLRKKL